MQLQVEALCMDTVNRVGGMIVTLLHTTNFEAGKKPRLL